MADLTRLNIAIDEIAAYMKRIENMNLKTEKDIDDIRFDAASMVLFSMINKTIDLAEEVVKIRDLGVPTKYRDLLEFIRRGKIISEERERKIADLIILRNNFAHRYERITKKDLLKIIKDISEIKKFIEDIKKEFSKK